MINIQYNKLKYLLIPTYKFFNEYLINNEISKFIIKSPNERLYYIEQLEDIIYDNTRKFCDDIEKPFISKSLQAADFIIIIVLEIENNILYLNFMTGEIINNKLFIHITCTDENYRGKGLFTRINRAIHYIAKIININKLVINSIEEKVPFYKKQGYTTNSSNNNLNYPLSFKIQKGGIKTTHNKKRIHLFIKSTRKSLKE